MEKELTHVPTVADLEKMTTHQLSNLLANIVLLLRRMPDVEVSDFFATNTEASGPEQQPPTIAEKVRKEPKSSAKGAKEDGQLPDWL